MALNAGRLPTKLTNEVIVDPEVLASIERDWRSGRLNTKLLSIKHGMDESKLVELAGRMGWGSRERIQDKIKDGTLHAMVEQHASSMESAEGGTLVDEDQQVSAYTKMVAGVLNQHQQGAARGRNLAERMLTELEEIQPPKIDQDAIDSLAAVVQKTNPELAEHLRAHIGPVNPRDKLNFLGRRIGMLNTLASTQETYINIERVTFGLNERSNGDGLAFDDVVDGARKAIGVQ